MPEARSSRLNGRRYSTYEPGVRLVGDSMTRTRCRRAYLPMRKLKPMITMPVDISATEIRMRSTQFSPIQPDALEGSRNPPIPVMPTTVPTARITHPATRRVHPYALCCTGRETSSPILPPFAS